MSKENKELAIRLGICLILLVIYMAMVLFIGENVNIRVGILVAAIVVALVPRKTKMEDISKDEAARWKILGWVLCIPVPLLIWLPKYLIGSYKPDITVLILLGLTAKICIDKLKIQNKVIDGVKRK